MNPDLVATLMRLFAARTGLLDPARPPTRYLWTDAFAVCNYLGQWRNTLSAEPRQAAEHLVDQVHHVLGKHRDDDSRAGWISGLDEEAGERHPTRGGLRIGKPLPERALGETYDHRLEWERDGQYFHYLTKWMHALAQTARATGDARYHRWAVELAEAAHEAFVYRTAGSAASRMYWKMAVDLSRPLVPSMGHHDPLDALVTYRELASAGEPGTLNEQIAEARGMCAIEQWMTDDPLGIGGLLIDASRLAQIAVRNASDRARPSDPDEELLEAILWAAAQGIDALSHGALFHLPADQRLAFRELGLAVGLRALGIIDGVAQARPASLPNADRLTAPLRALQAHVPLGESITNFWSDPRNRRAETWTEHPDINNVMLATSLDPDGFLDLGHPAHGAADRVDRQVVTP